MKKGFTIVELMAVTAIIAVLTSIVVVAARGSIRSSREKRATAMAKALQQGIAAFYAQEGKGPQAVESKMSSIKESYKFTADETDSIFQEVVGKGFGKGGGSRSVLVDASALFVANRSNLKNGGKGCFDNHANRSKDNYCGNQNCSRGIDFSEAVKQGGKHRIPFAQMAFGYPGKINGRFRRFWIIYNARTDSVDVSL